MNCLDCALAGLDRTSVAVCHACGAAVCTEHAVVRAHHLTRIVTINRPVPVEPPARLVWCQTCAAAHEAASHPQQAPHRHRGDRHRVTS